MPDTYMRPNEYQERAVSTAGDVSLTVLGLGIAGEAGEVADIIKKHVGHGHKLDTVKLLDELGDVLWYVAVMAHAVNLDLSTIMAHNQAKLARRYPNGFDPERSINREE